MGEIEEYLGNWRAANSAYNTAIQLDFPDEEKVNRALDRVRLKDNTGGSMKRHNQQSLRNDERTFIYSADSDASSDNNREEKISKQRRKRKTLTSRQRGVKHQTTKKKNEKSVHGLREHDNILSKTSMNRNHHSNTRHVHKPKLRNKAANSNSYNHITNRRSSNSLHEVPHPHRSSGIEEDLKPIVVDLTKTPVPTSSVENKVQFKIPPKQQVENEREISSSSVVSHARSYPSPVTPNNISRQISQPHSTFNHSPNPQQHQLRVRLPTPNRSPQPVSRNGLKAFRLRSIVQSAIGNKFQSSVGNGNKMQHPENSNYILAPPKNIPRSMFTHTAFSKKKVMEKLIESNVSSQRTKPLLFK